MKRKFNERSGSRGAEGAYTPPTFLFVQSIPKRAAFIQRASREWIALSRWKISKNLRLFVSSNRKKKKKKKELCCNTNLIGLIAGSYLICSEFRIFYSNYLNNLKMTKLIVWSFRQQQMFEFLVQATLYSIYYKVLSRLINGWFLLLRLVDYRN